LPNAVIERDAGGREQRADEVILVGRREAVDSLKSQGFDILGANRLSTSGEVIARVRVKSGDSVELTLDRLRAAVPGAVVAPNHVFRPSAGEGRGVPAATRASGGVKGRLGIVDTGVDVVGLHLSRSVLATRSFNGGAYTPREHGSAVAMIAANSGVAIDAADVFAADAQGALFTTAEAAAAAIDWLVDRGAPVINISIQGPDNPVLEKVVRSAIARGVVIVAAAGNSGPAAPPSYPAAYVGVVGVTAVDEQGRIYRRANRGDYISFAAVGVHVPVAGPQSVSGTSYAAPSVAAAVARRHQAQSPDAAARVLVQLRAEAIDLGPPGRDKTFGWGWLR
jgi:subtilisin family serine protease